METTIYKEEKSIKCLYAIGVENKEGYFSRLIERKFENEKEAYEYAKQLIKIGECKNFKISVKKIND